jgi:hypothetical protein
VRFIIQTCGKVGPCLVVRCTVLFALVGSLFACSLDNTRPSDSYVGTWHLRTVNGQPLPYDDGAGSITVSQEITIQKHRSFSGDATSILSGQQVVSSYSGSCAFNAPIQLICTVADGSAFGFVWQGDSLYTAVPSGFLSVYKR